MSLKQGSIYEYLQAENACDIILCDDLKNTQKIIDIALFLNKDVLEFPDFRAIKNDDLRSYKNELYDLFNALYDYYKADKKPLIVSTFYTFINPLPIQKLLTQKTISFGDSLDIQNFKKHLLYWGYTFVDIVQEKGEVSFRGDIIDIFSIHSDNPIRLSLFDVEVESIRKFDLDSQKSIKEELESFDYRPTLFGFNAEEYEKILHLCQTNNNQTLFKDINSFGFWNLEHLALDFLTNKKVMLSHDFKDDIQAHLNINKIKNNPFETYKPVPEADHFRDIKIVDLHGYLEIHKNLDITIIVKNEAQLKQYNVDPKGKNIVYKDVYLNLISMNTLIISLNKSQRKSKIKKQNMILDELKAGDYVVHENYGVALFNKIEQITVLGSKRDFVILQYQGDDKLLLPVENLDLIDRFVANSGILPVQDKLGKGSFAKLKSKVKTKLLEIAAGIIEIAASRNMIDASKIYIDSDDLKYFQSKAGFTYTKDQETSIKEMLEEMAKSKVMDRLLSGDVGFGKTEVAMNGLYSAYKAGFQSAIIVPTTLLSSQHFISLQDRFKFFGVNIAKLDRFISAKARKEIIANLKNGTIDMVVGTHSLFGVAFKQLGLVVVDEEHKFGVKQKEKLKELHQNVHLLSMSATPIPRSLNMALTSIKTLSTLTTPPSDRLGVRTFVKNYDNNLLKEVILRELRRGGQIFYVFNSIANIQMKKIALEKILPDLKIVVLHSKISPVESEKDIMKFHQGKYDILLATSIIESGIHIPNANTMIIDNADRFGVADLHQLRGRVGRGNKEGYAYFLVNDSDLLTPDATKRLMALESNSYLGAGSALAYHDLEIRGGGNLLGEAQSGHIKNIGYSLYLKMLEEAIASLSNTQIDIKQKQSVDIKLTVSAYLSENIITEDRLRLELYRRLSKADTAKMIYEIQEEVIDRFGQLDEITKQFFDIMVIKLLCIQNKIKTVGNYNENITFTYADETKQNIKARSKDDDDVIDTTLKFLRV
jgi:transcription-repair coupling factor (superfamily II helicase)